MPRWSLLGAAALFLVGGAAACAGGGDDDSKADIKKDIVATLQRGDDAYDHDTAECYADLIIDEVGLEELRDVDVADDEPSPKLADALAAAAQRAAEECDIAADGG